MASNAEQQKYDRQLRLWGVHGQKKLMNSHICLINAGPTGTEALKNLVLPGIGQFTVVDPNTVSSEDCSNNFFVEPSSVGKDRAEVVKSLLMEMNPDCKGHAVVKDARDIVKDDPGFFSKFTLVIATQIDENSLIALSEVCSKFNVHLVIARTYGLIGHVRVFMVEHHVLELKLSPEPAPDLRVFNPWPQLKALADSIGFSQLDTFEFKHVPFVLVLIKLLDQWRASHDGRPPQNQSQKEEFKKSIKAIARLPWGEEENLSEALNSAFQAYAKVNINGEVVDIFNDKKCEELTHSSSHFWIMARALRDFARANDNILPLPGTLPDMTATTERFVELQKCYAGKAKNDFEDFSSLVDKHLKQLGLAASTIPADERQMFCANASGLRVIRSTTLKDEFTKPDPNRYLGFDEPNELPLHMQPAMWYLLWRACDAIYAKTGAYPGSNPSATEAELAQSAEEVFATTKALIESQYKAAVPNSALTMDCATEMVRYGGSEMHNIAALIGGIAAEESVKLITQQYQPLNNTFVFNGISSVGVQICM